MFPSVHDTVPYIAYPESFYSPLFSALKIMNVNAYTSCLIAHSAINIRQLEL